MAQDTNRTPNRGVRNSTDTTTPLQFDCDKPGGVNNDPNAFEKLLQSINTMNLLDSNANGTRPAASDHRSRFFSNNMFGSLADVNDEEEDQDTGSDDDFAGGIAVSAPDSNSKRQEKKVTKPRIRTRRVKLTINKQHELPMNHGIKGLLSSTPTQHVHNVSAFNISTTRPFAEQELRIPSGPSHNSVNANNNGRYPRNRNYFEDHGARRGSHGLRGGYHSRSSTSYTWQSPEQKHMQDFVIVRNAMRRLFKNSEVSKWKLADYLAHQNAMIASQQHYLNRQLAAKDASSSRSLSSSLDDYSASLRDQVVANLHTEGNASLVLGEKTIWCHDWENGKEEVAEWPTYAEMKWEGDDRAKTAVGRFLPLPREMGAPGIIWSQLQVVDQYPLDQVCRIPTMEDVYAPVDEIEDDVKYYLVSHDLEDAIDEFLES